VCLAAHVSESPGWTPGYVKLLLPPRQSRGNSQVGLGISTMATEIREFEKRGQSVLSYKMLGDTGEIFLGVDVARAVLRSELRRASCIQTPRHE
jgi:hypothetical protein